jgi:hypothetical protein
MDIGFVSGFSFQSKAPKVSGAFSLDGPRSGRLFQQCFTDGRSRRPAFGLNRDQFHSPFLISHPPSA